MSVHKYILSKNKTDKALFCIKPSLRTVILHFKQNYQLQKRGGVSNSYHIRGYFVQITKQKKIRNFITDRMSNKRGNSGNIKAIVLNNKHSEVCEAQRGNSKAYSTEHGG
jgi:hypothetical protein